MGRRRLNQLLIRGFIANGCEKSVTPTTTSLQGPLKTDTLRPSYQPAPLQALTLLFVNIIPAFQLFLKGVYVNAIIYADAGTFLPRHQRVSTHSGAQRRD
jgi:hypothetical protein